MDSINKYEDIINMEHPTSKKHPIMGMRERAAQFAPFAALTGLGAAINETARLTNERIEIDEQEKIIIDNKLQLIQEKIKLNPEVAITYFVKDVRKNGGSYITKKDNVKKIDEFKNIIILNDNTKIPINDIYDIIFDDEI